MKKANKFPYRLLLLVVLALAVIVSVVGTGYAKYKTDVILTNEVSQSNQLADSFRLLQKQAAVQPDGSYVFSDSPVTSEAYYLIPGIHIDQTPYIVVTGKTDIPAYLYLEVIGSGLDPKLGYQLASDWTRLEGVKGRQGGDMYVFRDGFVLDAESLSQNTAGDTVTHDLKVDILASGFGLGREPITAEQDVSFCGYLLQAAHDSALETFVSRFPQK